MNQKEFLESGWVDNKQTKAEQIAEKGELSGDDWDYVMTMGHSEYREYSLAVSKNRGYIKHMSDTETVNLKLTKKEVDLIIHCINTNATTKADVKENLLRRIRNGI